jgi:hypothetical protein
VPFSGALLLLLSSTSNPGVVHPLLFGLTSHSSSFHPLIFILYLITSDFPPSFLTSTPSSGFTPGSVSSTLSHSVLPFSPWPYPLTSVLLPAVFIHHPFPRYFYTLVSFLTYPLLVVY